MGIDLGASQACMTQQFFHRIEFCSIVRQVCGKGMPQHMGAFLESVVAPSMLFLTRRYIMLGYAGFPVLVSSNAPPDPKRLIR